MKGRGLAYNPLDPIFRGSVEPALLGGRAAEEATRDQLALMGERTGRYRMTGALVPVSCIRKIAFFPVQIGMDPSALTIYLVDLDEAVGLLPVPTCIPPEGLQRMAPALRRLGMMKGDLEGVGAHDSAS